MIVGIDPKVDYAFKHLFGKEANRLILIDLIDNVLDLGPGQRILDIDLLNPFNPKEAVDDKLSILDVKARDQAGRHFNVEMQMLAYRHYEKRILYYWAKLHQQQLREGEDYLELKPTIAISFLDHVLFPQAPDHHLRFRLQETAQHFSFTDVVEVHILELPKFNKPVAELANGLDIWLYFLRNAAMMDIDALPTEMQQPMVKRALEELKMLNQTDRERERYESRRTAQLDYNTGLKVAHMEGERIGAIHLCERLLNRPETPRETLLARSFDELDRMIEELQAGLLKK